jgi:hypothetical protein
MAFEPTDAERQLMDLRALTAVTGVLHDAQLLQLRMWAGLAFSWTKWEIRIDVESKTAIFVVEKKAHPKNMAQLIGGLDRSVQWLLGPDWGVRVTEGNKALYEGLRDLKSIHEQRKSRVRRREGNKLPQ